MRDWLGDGHHPLLRPGTNVVKKVGKVKGPQQWMMRGADDKLLEELCDRTGPKFRTHPHALQVDDITLDQESWFCDYCYTTLKPRQRRYG